MNRTFNKQQIAQIAIQVRQYKKLYVTTEGQMFMSEEAAEEAIRVKNALIDEPSDYVGFIKMTEDMVADEKLRLYARNVDAFGELFKEAKIPRSKETKATHERKRETPKKDDATTVKNVTSALGVEDETKPLKT